MGSHLRSSADRKRLAQNKSNPYRGMNRSFTRVRADHVGMLTLYARLQLVEFGVYDARTELHVGKSIFPCSMNLSKKHQLPFAPTLVSTILNHITCSVVVEVRA